MSILNVDVRCSLFRLDGDWIQLIEPLGQSDSFRGLGIDFHIFTLDVCSCRKFLSNISRLKLRLLDLNVLDVHGRSDGSDILESDLLFSGLIIKFSESTILNIHFGALITEFWNLESWKTCLIDLSDSYLWVDSLSLNTSEFFELHILIKDFDFRGIDCSISILKSF